MKVLITGANGFLGKNLQLQLSERSDVEIITFSRENHSNDLVDMISDVDMIFHLAGENRPINPHDYISGNVDLTVKIANAIVESGKKIPIIFTSSVQATLDNKYGISKRAAEEALHEIGNKHDVPVYLFRLSNVFGKWSKPNYNSVVATFCYNISRGLPIKIDNPDVSLALVYVDDVVERFIQLMDGAESVRDYDGFELLSPQYTVTVGELAKQIKIFKDSRSTLMIERVGNGFLRALYSTYVSYLPKESFAYHVMQYRDSRGIFVEMLKTPDCGQISYFTAHPGITRGGHYHQTKTEKFLVIKGLARFIFTNILSGEIHELVINGEVAEIVETVPGWAHEITNIGNEELIVMLWANEVFGHNRPDTYSYPLRKI